MARATFVTKRDGSPPPLFAGHHEGVELVTVGIAEVAGIEAAATVPRSALVGAAVAQRDIVERLTLRLVARLEGNHDAFADARCVPVERLGVADARAASR